MKLCNTKAEFGVLYKIKNKMQTCNTKVEFGMLYKI